MTSEGPSKQLLISGAAELGIELSVAQANACLHYLSELKKWNRKINLTAIEDDKDIIVKHFLDSFSFLRGIEPKPGTRLLDMGSGAGFPALPLKIVFPELDITMAESVRKKAAFLRHAIRTLGLAGIDVVDKRTEDMAASFQARFDVVTARAFAAMMKALAAGAGFLRSGGVIVLSRGPEEGIEKETVGKCGFDLEKRELLTLPFSDHRRAIWVFRKKA